MTTTQRARRTARSAALAAVTAAVALGMTACGAGGEGAKAAGGAHAAGTAQSRPVSSGDRTGSVEQAESAGGSAVGTRSAAVANGTGKVTGKAATAAAQQCRGDEMLVTAVHRFAGRQGDHLLVTAWNEGSAPCWVTSYPAVKLGDDIDVAALPHSKKDNPGGGKHLTLRPGGKVYSAVNLFDYGSKHHTARSFAIALRGADGRPGPFYSVDVTGRTSRFSWNEADVLNWSNEKPYDF